MSDIKLIIEKSRIQGEITAPPSKSFTHRGVIAASLSDGISRIYNPLICEDTISTIEACKALGAKIEFRDGFLQIEGVGGKKSKKPYCFIDCKESGSTLRFILPIAGIFCRSGKITGRRRLLKRPVSHLIDVLHHLNFNITKDLSIRNSFPKPGTIKIPGNISSQYISGLLFALPLLRGESIILITTEIESKNYILMTLDVLKEFGIKIGYSSNLRKFIIKGNQQYKPKNYKIEGDYSGAAFLFAAALLSGKGKVIIRGLNPFSLQGDREILDIFQKMGGNIKIKENAFIVRKSHLHAVNIDAKHIPDLVPVLAIVASRAEGKTRIRNIERLKIKESNRLEAILTQLRKMEVGVAIKKNLIEIKGKQKPKGTVIDTYQDHRIAMAFSVAGLVAEGSTTISDPVCVKKSYPEFFDDMRKLGAKIIPITPPFGKKIKLSIYGDSHGEKIGMVLRGIPKNLKITREYIQKEVDKRKSVSSLSTPRREEDKIHIIQGIKNGLTDGMPIIIEIFNKNTYSEAYELIKYKPRPGHADFPARIKYASVFDYRGGGFASGRMTVAMVAAGAIAKKFLRERGVKICAYVKQAGDIKMNRKLEFQEIEKNTYSNSVRCPDFDTARKMERKIKEIKKKNDSIGGIVECQIVGLPIGLGEPVFDSVESVLSHAVFSIPAIKGIEFGSGFQAAKMKGSQHNDNFYFDKKGVVFASSNHNGGILGGITYSMPICFRVAVKPTSSIGIEQDTIDLKSFKNTKIKVQGRHDPCIAIRVPPVVEAMSAISILDLYLRENDPSQN